MVIRFVHFLTALRTIGKAHGLTAVSMTVFILLYSCKDETVPGSSPTSRLRFSSRVSASWTPSTRADAPSATPENTVIPLEGSGTPLYLHSSYTDSIASPPAVERPDTVRVSRAVPITSENLYRRFSVSAFSYQGDWNDGLTPDFFYDRHVSKADNEYVLAEPALWPGSAYKLRFFAYAPVAEAAYRVSGRDKPGAPEITVAVPEDVSKQHDLLVAATEELAGDYRRTVDLNFRHALTAVRFVCGEGMQAAAIQHISLKKVYAEGVYHMGSASWSNVRQQKDFTQTLEKQTSGTAGEALTAPAQTFMMVPQTLPEGAQVEVQLTDGKGESHTLTADLKGAEWPMGKTVTYKISTSSINWTYTLEVSQPEPFLYLGGKMTYFVTSYRTNGKGIKEAVKWNTQFSTNGGSLWVDEHPIWLAAFTTSGVGGETPQQFDAAVVVSKGENITYHSKELRLAPEKGTKARPYNLANQTDGGASVQNTANCYVVSAPGYYSFPLVYGNAVKNGQANPSAYTSSETDGNILKTFINHLGQPITDPYIISNAGCVPAKAELVWQDAPHLVTEIAYDSTDKGNISFKVDKGTICQGNAVIAIKDADDNILWSWHIWVTDEDISQTIEVTNRQQKKYGIMPVNLGWCDARAIAYAERSCKVRFMAGEVSKEIIIKQSPALITIIGNNPYYQWGRKDPFQPSDGLTDINKTWYDKYGHAHTDNPKTKDLSKGLDCIKNYILTPDVMQCNIQGDFTYDNLWSTNAHGGTSSFNLKEDVKTIYDPSPVDFKIPDLFAFTGFSKSVFGESEISDAMVEKWNQSLKGWYFYTDDSKSKTILFPASGARSASEDRLGYVRFIGFYWTALPMNMESGFAMIFNQFYVYPLRYAHRAEALAVRPCRE